MSRLMTNILRPIYIRSILLPSTSSILLGKYIAPAAVVNTFPMIRQNSQKPTISAGSFHF